MASRVHATSIGNGRTTSSPSNPVDVERGNGDGGVVVRGDDEDGEEDRAIQSCCKRVVVGGVEGRRRLTLLLLMLLMLLLVPVVDGANKGLGDSFRDDGSTIGEQDCLKLSKKKL